MSNLEMQRVTYYSEAAGTDLATVMVGDSSISTERDLNRQDSMREKESSPEVLLSLSLDQETSNENLISDLELTRNVAGEFARNLGASEDFQDALKVRVSEVCTNGLEAHGAVEFFIPESVEREFKEEGIFTFYAIDRGSGCALVNRVLGEFSLATSGESRRGLAMVKACAESVTAQLIGPTENQIIAEEDEGYYLKAVEVKMSERSVKEGQRRAEQTAEAEMERMRAENPDMDETDAILASSGFDLENIPSL